MFTNHSDSQHARGLELAVKRQQGTYLLLLYLVIFDLLFSFAWLWFDSFSLFCLLVGFFFFASLRFALLDLTDFGLALLALA